MKTFKAERLPKLTKIMYDSQQRLSKNNWEDTLKANHREIEKLLVMVSIFDTWRNTLERKYGTSARDLIKETFMDSYMSIYFACMSLYKQAHVSLRAELETVLRLVYFSSHPIELKWWKDDKAFFKGKHVWGDNYDYFMHLDDVNNFKGKAGGELFDKVRAMYTTLSKYVHSNFSSFQTTIQGVAPAYKKAEFGKWLSRFKDVQKYVNTVLALGLSEDFKSLGVVNQRKVLKVIGDATYKRALKQSLGLIIRGRV